MDFNGDQRSTYQHDYGMREVVDTLRRASAREAFVVKKYIIFFLENDSWQDPYSSAGIVYPFEAALKLQFGPSTH